MTESLEEKLQGLMSVFAGCVNAQGKYEKIIELGRAVQPMASEFKVEQYLVRGCQSIMYLKSAIDGDRIYFQSESDALISSGLAALLTSVYSGESPEVILTSPPKYLDDLNIPATLSPSRANGLANIYLRMKQDALKLLVAAKR